MKWLNWWLFPKRRGTIRRDPDYLPGLKPPTRAPWIPQPPAPEKPGPSSVETAYEKFKAAGVKPKAGKTKHDRGVGF